jgi:hypothetical protein
MPRRTKKKQLTKTIRDVRSVAAREVAPSKRDAEGRGYPTALDLIAAPQWHEFLQNALRSVLRPAALAGAVGLAGMGAGCGSEDGVLPAVSALFDDGEQAPAGSPTVTFTPIPNGISMPPPPLAPPPASTWVTVTPIPPGTQPEPPCPLPPPVVNPPGHRPPRWNPPRTAGRMVPVRPPVPPATNPPHVLGQMVPVMPPPPPPRPPVVPAHPNPPMIRGDIAMVVPDPVPVPLGGAPMQVRFVDQDGDAD